MKFIAAPILILLLVTQTFSKWVVVISFNLNRDYIAKNLCENRYRPVLKCNGNCVLMKKMKQRWGSHIQKSSHVFYDGKNALQEFDCVIEDNVSKRVLLNEHKHCFTLVSFLIFQRILIVFFTL